MSRERTPLPDLNVVTTFLRQGLGWGQAELADRAGIALSVVNDYEAGRRTLTRQRADHLAGCMGLGPEILDENLERLHANRAASRALARPGDPFAESRRQVAALAARAGRLAADFVRSLLQMLTVEGEALHARQQAEALWKYLESRKPSERRVLVEDARRFHTWALCERLAAESLALAPNHPRQALELARLALAIALRVPGEKAWRRRVEGYALAHVANSRKCCSDLPGAGRDLARAAKLWEAGAPADPGLLNPAMLPWIAAGQYKAQRRLPQALARVEEALRLDPGELRGKILLTKSNILRRLDDPAGSTAALEEAAPLIDAEREPRLALIVRHNLIIDLCELDMAAEAELRLPEVRRLAERLGEPLDLERTVWLSGKVDAGLGRLAAARAAFEQVRRTFATEELAYDYALFSLDLALVHLAEDRTAEVRRLAEEMLWIFNAQSVHCEALAALRLFCDAARREAATAELVQSVRRYLRRAQDDPGLRFAGKPEAEVP